MKRQGHLIEKIADLTNLHLAFYKAKKGKAGNASVLEYEKRLQENLQDLQRQLVSGDVNVGSYHTFTIYDPKKRLICAAPFGQRVLHHALMNHCHSSFEKAQVFDSYASRISKGTYAALERAKHFNKRYKWFLKLDFRKYFDSLDHAVLKRQLSSLFKDSRLLSILGSIIDSYEVTVQKGVPIGNLTSQYFANHYLAQADHTVKEVLKIKAYIRYMDDLVLYHNDKDALLAAGLRLQKYAEGELKLTLKPFCLNRNSHGLPFLGYLLFPENVRLAQRSRIRFIRKMHDYEKHLDAGTWTQQEYQNHISPLIAFTEFANAKKFRRGLVTTTQF